MVHIMTEKSLNTKSVKGNLNTKFVYDENLKKISSKRQFIISKLVEFCKRTDLHGFRYIVMEDFNIFERSGWAFAVILSIVTAASFVVMAYKWYARNPIVTVIESTQGAIWDVPFPAITICDLNIVSLKAAQNLTKQLKLPENVTEDFVFKTLKLIPLLFSTFPSEPKQKADLNQLQTILDLNNKSIEDVFSQRSYHYRLSLFNAVEHARLRGFYIVWGQTSYGYRYLEYVVNDWGYLSPASQCINLVQRCMWKNTVYPCDELFTPIFTLLGQCCTFNYFAVDDLGTELNKKTSYEPETPRRVASCGYQTALTVLLYTDPDDYYSATVASQGALVMIDSAYNIPDLDSPVRMVNPSTEVLIALSPERTYATEGIKNFEPKQRHCYYSNEWLLGGLRQYSFHNCMAHEKVQFLLKACQCVPLFLPMKGMYRKCNFKDLNCIDDTLRNEEYQKRNSGVKVDDSECLPECEHYDYPLEVAVGKLADKKYVNYLPFFDGVILKNHSLLNVFFNDLVSTRYRRDVYLNWQNILAAFGGLLSLMLGFTLIAGIDLVLFFTLRVAYNICIATRKFNSGRNKIKVQEQHKTSSWTGNTVRREPKPQNFNTKDEYYYSYGRY